MSIYKLAHGGEVDLDLADNRGVILNHAGDGITTVTIHDGRQYTVQGTIEELQDRIIRETGDKLKGDQKK